MRGRTVTLKSASGSASFTLAPSRSNLGQYRCRADTGYADQSHLSRETRRITGFPPGELRRRIIEDESFWVYRIWT